MTDPYWWVEWIAYAIIASGVCIILYIAMGDNNE